MTHLPKNSKMLSYPIAETINCGQGKHLGDTVRVWKVTWIDGTTNYLWAETAYAVRHEIYRDQRNQIAAVTAVPRGACGDLTNPHTPSGLPGHRGGGPRGLTGAAGNVLATKPAQTPNRVRQRFTGHSGAFGGVLNWVI